MNINELKLVIAEVLEEAKKRTEKAIKARENSGRAKNAYGTYAEALDFSWPLGPYNLYRQQGQVNWGPYTSDGPHIDQNFANPNTAMNTRMGSNTHPHLHESDDELALRQVIREVIEYGLVPAESAWAPLMESAPRQFDTIWEEAMHECDRWYMRNADTGPIGEPKKKTSLDRTRYGKVARQGPPEDQGGKGRKAW